jgi:hypothetical protein
MASKSRSKRGAGASLFWDLLTFDRLMTNTVIHLIYWAGLGVIALGAFGTIGAAVGVACCVRWQRPRTSGPRSRWGSETAREGAGGKPPCFT